MKIEKEGKVLKLQLENKETNLDGILNNDDMFLNDLYFKIDNGGCLWIFDNNKNLAYDLTNNCFYANIWKEYNVFKTLLKGEKVELIAYSDIEEAEREFF